MVKRIISLALAALLTVLCLAACGGGSGNGTETDENGNVVNNNSNGNGSSGNGNNNASGGGNSSGSNSNNNGSDEDLVDPTGRYTKFDLRTSYDATEAATVTFTDSAVTVQGKGASADGTTLYINTKGTYRLTGSCSDGRIIVEVPTSDKVHLVFNGLKLECKSNAAVWVKSADKTSITLVEGTVNSLSDSGAYKDTNADGEPNACLFSKDDITINGTGTLEVTGNVNNGITSKDDLKIVSGTIKVTAKNHGIRGNDSVSIRDGVITIVAKNDGIKSSKEDKENKGYIYIEGGTISIDAGDDCLQAPSDITVTGGSITTDAGGKVVNCDGTTYFADGTLK